MGQRQQAGQWILAVSAGAVLLALVACGAGNVILSTKNVSVPPVTAKVYAIDATDNVLLEYQITNSTAAQIGTLALPAGFSPTLVATDPAGGLYVGGNTGSAQATEVVVYAAGAVGAATPLRTVSLTAGKLTALAADAKGQIYAGKLNTLSAVEVYPATANGTATPATVLNPAHFQYLNDVAVAASGAISVSGWNGGAYFIDTFAPGASGPAIPTAELYAPTGSYFGGIAIDGYGNLWAMEQLSIVEFAPGAAGTPQPLNTITLPNPGSPYTGQAYSNVLRVDSNGLLYVPVTWTGSGTASSVAVFAPTQNGAATPAVTVAMPQATQSTPLATNIAIAVR